MKAKKLCFFFLDCTNTIPTTQNYAKNTVVSCARKIPGITINRKKWFVWVRKIKISGQVEEL